MERLTHKRVSGGISTGYWSPAKKQELVDRLAMYEDTVVPEWDFEAYLIEVKEMAKNWKKDGLSYISRRCQLLSVICGIEDDSLMLTVGQIKRLINLI